MSQPPTPLPRSVDVIVIGGGNAGFTAAHAAATRGRSVLLLERGPEDLSGGNSFYTAGATRIAHSGLGDLASFVEADPRHSVTEVPPYSAIDYAADVAKVTSGRNDPELTRILVEESQSVLRWLHDLGLRYRLMYERQAYERPDGSFLFWGGLHVGNVDGGKGLIADHRRVAANLAYDVRYGTMVTGFLTAGATVIGVRAIDEAGVPTEITAESVVIAAGGFEANATMREQYLGSGWGKAKVRGTPLNTGELLTAAIDLGAARGGDWSTAHSVQWDAFHTDNESNRELTNRFTRQSYPLGIIVNKSGKRFLDEGEDFRNLTYAKFGGRILEQEDGIAYQIFDARLRPMLRAEEYDMPGISVTSAGTIGEIADLLGIDRPGFERTVTEFNASIDRSATFDPNVKDGRAARVSPPKSNWANPLEIGPFYAYPVTCGITFTFGGLKGDIDGRVLSDAGVAIPGLFAVGEALGGLFSGNYPGGSGLAAGAVFGRRAGLVA
ncbi:FAD-dependent tricarballylate dehydrogenase TcuA [Cryobacterium sp. Y57]|uniref:FAD-dependent tricarballylate dehydrogenase TcuA n=1 Tax=Cryobacterium sp. Y57 TaxID=2048287 RepID=UPI000CE54F86|nr:FAD-dependent tricarballylate dehydrogenase TcuA [Cryobacterium sp. Y57]